MRPLEKGEFYVVFITETVHHEGDERSRTHPGHGYPAHTTTHQEVIKFTDEEALLDWLKKEESKVFGKRDYKVARCQEVKVRSTLQVQVLVDE
jgi:hypothetical protein